MEHAPLLPFGPAARRPTRQVRIGNVAVGGDAPVVVQSMTNTDTADIAATTKQVAELWRAGSELVRVTVNTHEAAAAVPRIVDKLALMGVDVPVIGDFHYNGHHLLAKEPACARALAKYRINPGNVGFGRSRLGSQQLVAVVVEIADQRHRRAHHRQPVDDARHGGGGLGGVDGDAYHLRAGAPQFGHLLHRRGDVGGVGVGHRLHHHRRIAADQHVADPDLAGCAARGRAEGPLGQGGDGGGVVEVLGGRAHGGIVRVGVRGGMDGD